MRKTFILSLAFLLTGCQSPRITSIRDNEAAASSPTSTLEVSIYSSKFDPASILIEAGQTITIANHDNRKYTIISDPHPTHDQIPSLYKVIFKNEIAQFTFADTGIYGIHLEENPSIKLQIMVK